MRFFILPLALVSTTALAQDVDVYVDDSSTKLSIGTNNSSGYESSTGNRYEYDLSDPGDQVDYSVDVDAQMRDEISVNPTREIDRDLGEYGGGIYD